MASYAVFLAKSARKELESHPDSIIERLLTKLDELGDTPRPAGCRKLSGESDLWRVRVGDYRIIYSVDDAQRSIDVTAIRHRKDAYR